MRLDATTGELTATIPMQGGLKATIGRHRGLWVITEAGSLHRVDLESNQVSHSVDALDVELLDERLFDPAIAQVDDHIWIVLHSGEVIAVPIV